MRCVFVSDEYICVELGVLGEFVEYGPGECLAIGPV